MTKRNKPDTVRLDFDLSNIVRIKTRGPKSPTSSFELKRKKDLESSEDKVKKKMNVVVFLLFVAGSVFPATKDLVVGRVTFADPKADNLNSFNFGIAYTQNFVIPKPAIKMVWVCSPGFMLYAGVTGTLRDYQVSTTEWTYIPDVHFEEGIWCKYDDNGSFLFIVKRAKNDFLHYGGKKLDPDRIDWGAKTYPIYKF